MSRRFDFDTKWGKYNSLKHPMNIALTLTPTESSQPFDPVLRRLMHFHANSQEYYSFEEELVFAFCFYYKPAEPTGLNGRICCKMDDKKSEPVSMGQSVTYNYYQWDKPEPSKDNTALGQKSITVVNKSNSRQWVALCIKLIGQSTFKPIVAFHPIEIGGKIVVSNLVAQAYLVGKEISDQPLILRPGDLRCPIFTTPLVCNALPPVSKWILCQNRQGEPELKDADQSVDDSEPGSRSNETLTKSINGVKDQLAALMRSVDSTEKAIIRGEIGKLIWSD